MVSEEVIVGDRPGAPNVGLAPQPGTPNTLKTDLRRQYVAAGGWQWYANYARTLSFAVDDVTTDFGSDLYERIYLNPHAAGLSNGFRAAILEDGLNLRPAVENEDEDGYDQAKQLLETHERVLRELDPDLDAVLWDLSSACYLGNRVAEITYDDTPLGAGLPKLYAAKIVCKPRESTAFVVNTFNDVLGLLGRVPGVGQPVYVGTLLTDPAKSPNLIPREKFLILSWRPVNGDPRGTSMFRPLYDPWYRLVQIQGEELKFLARFGSPGLVGTTPENAEAEPLLDANGNVIGLGISPEQELVANLAAWQNGAAIALPHGTEVQGLWPSSGRTGPFEVAKDSCKKDMTYAFTSQTLATDEGKGGGNRMAGEVHQDTYDTLVRQGKRAIERAFYRDVLRRMVEWNEGAALLPLTPRPSLGVQEARDAAADLTALAALQTSEYVRESQRPGLSKKFGLPADDPAIDDAAAAKKAALAPPKLVVPGFGPGNNTPPNAKQPNEPPPAAEKAKEKVAA